MTDNAIIVTVDSVRSRASTQETLLTLAVPQEYAPMVAKFLGMIHQPVAVAFAEVERGDAPAKATKPPKEEKPYGMEAAELYRTGFFFNPKVLEAIGTDEEFLEWVKSQPCWRSDNPGKGPLCDGDVVAAHVRRISNGAGIAIKPPYSAVPLCNAHHQQQHQHGESALGGKEWFDKMRAHYVQKWASATLARLLDCPSGMGYVAPEKLRAWARERDLDFCLPECYRRVFTSKQAD